MGELELSAGKYHADENDKGLRTMEDHRFYGLSAPLVEEFTNKDKELVIQFSVKFDEKMDCGGAYIKLLPDMDQSKFGGDTPYHVMFGPDLCGYSNRRTHVIFNYPPKNDNILIKDDVKMESEQHFTHLYTLVVRPDNTFEVFIDMESVRSGSLESAFDFMPAKEIKDPKVSKPADWVDDKFIADPNDKKPEGYDDVPSEIVDPEATKPEDWDDEEDGEWEAPIIPNPDYKGPWKPKQIENPAYKGEWVHPMIPNPDYKEDKELYIRANKSKYVGFELWQVTAGVIFDDILVADSYDDAKAAAALFEKKKAAEKIAIEEGQKAESAKHDTPASDNKDDDDEEEHDEL
jgi:calreticulin